MQKVESQVVKEKVWSKDAKALNLWPTTEVKRSSPARKSLQVVIL